jgi:hypothetical protein
MLNKMERMMMEQMIADLEMLQERNGERSRHEMNDAMARKYAFSEGSIHGRIHLIKQLLQVLK